MCCLVNLWLVLYPGVLSCMSETEKYELGTAVPVSRHLGVKSCGICSSKVLDEESTQITISRTAES
jgi:hypothetical protein